MSGEEFGESPLIEHLIELRARLMRALEAKGLLDRAVETLPSPAALAEREARGALKPG